MQKKGRRVEERNRQDIETVGDGSGGAQSAGPVQKGFKDRFFASGLPFPPPSSQF